MKGDTRSLDYESSMGVWNWRSGVREEETKVCRMIAALALFIGVGPCCAYPSGGAR